MSALSSAAPQASTSRNIFDLLHQRIDPAARLLETGDGTVMTYGDMLRRTAQLANVLAVEGVEPGDRVAVQVEKSPENLMLHLAALRAGAVYLPLNTAYTASEVAYFVGDAEPKLVVCDPAKREAIAKVIGPGVKLLTLDAAGRGELADLADRAPTEFATVPRAATDLAAILYTSGTTGRSKGAMLTHRALEFNAVCLTDYWRFTKSDVLLNALPIYHTHGLFVACHTVMWSGGSMIFLPKFDAEQVLDLLPRVTSMMGVPTFYTRLLQSPRLTPELCRNMRLFTSGSAPLLAETHRDFFARTGQAILERYGMTETNMNTSNPYDGERRPGTVGFPLPGVSLRVANAESGAALPAGEIGIIEVKGDNVFPGYWKRPELNATEFRPDGYFITGDIGMVDDRGYVHIVGRAKDLVITGGFNVYPKEIEEQIDALPGVLESAVIGLPHADFGEAVTAVVVRKPGAEVTEKGVVAALDGQIAKFKLPKRVLFVDDLPRNTMGKVQKNLLRDANRDLYAKK